MKWGSAVPLKVSTDHSTARWNSFFEYSLLPLSFNVAPKALRSY